MLILALACTTPGDPGDTGTEDTAQAAPGEGAIALTFAMDTDYMALMEEEASGSFYGAFWRGEEVSSIGPEEGAVSLGSIRVDGITLPADGSATAVLYTHEGLPAEEVVVLGFLDSDGNADLDSPSPDSKDPVTLPGDNDFDIAGGETPEARVFFGFLNP